MRAPAEATDDVTEAADGLEGVVEACSADRVIDEIEALAAGMRLNIAFDALVPVAPRRAEAADVVGLGRPVDGMDIGADRLGDLDDDMADTAGTQHQHLLPSLHL